MSYSLVYWINEKTWSIISSQDLVENSKVRCVTYVKYRGKLYEARLLRQSDKHEELSSLTITADGFLRDFPVSVALGKNVDKGNKKQQKGKSKIKASTERLPPVYEDPCRKDLRHQSSKSTPTTASDSLEAPVRSTRASRPVSVQQDLKKAPRTAKEQVVTAALSPSGQVNIQQTVRVPALSGGVLDESHGHPSSSETSDSESVQAGSNNNEGSSSLTAAENVLQAPVPSIDVIQFFESYTSWWRQNAKSAADTGLTISQSSSAVSNPSPALKDDMVELLPGHPQALIGRRKRNVLTKFYKDNPANLITQLLKAIIPSNDLKNLSARGHTKSQTDRKPIPLDIMTAIEEYAALHCNQKLSHKKVTKVVNNALQELRNPGRARKKMKSSEQSQPDVASSGEPSPSTANSQLRATTSPALSGPPTTTSDSQLHLPSPAAQSHPSTTTNIQPHATPPAHDLSAPASGQSPWKVSPLGNYQHGNHTQGSCSTSPWKVQALNSHQFYQQSCHQYSSSLEPNAVVRALNFPQQSPNPFIGFYDQNFRC